MKYLDFLLTKIQQESTIFPEILQLRYKISLLSSFMKVILADTRKQPTVNEDSSMVVNIEKSSKINKREASERGKNF